jgi:UDP-4-amino-4,6-dideoxy-N-acetyl-beta-L-altrosamine transaminase
LIPYGKHTVNLADALAVGWQVFRKSLTQGPKVEEFESLVASYTGAKYAVAVSSATAGLHISVLALELPEHSKVATSPISFVASANSIRYADLEPVFVDIDPQTINVSSKLLDQVCSNDSKISAVIPVHYAGLSCDMLEVSRIARKHGLRVVEDAAHAFGASYSNGEKIGNCMFSDLTVFSFHPVKSVTTGEGGVITTNSHDLYQKLLRLRSHGINKLNDEIHDEILGYTDGKLNPWYYEMQDLGFHYRMSEIQASLGCSQMKRLDSFMKLRLQKAIAYDEAFKHEVNFRSAQSVSKGNSGNHIYPIRINFDKLGVNRSQLMEKLRGLGIGTQVHYLPIPLHPYYRKLGYTSDTIPEAMRFYSECLTIPLYPKLKSWEQSHIIKALKKELAS